MTLLMYRNANTVNAFMEKVEERRKGYFHTYLLTIDFAKDDGKEYLHRFQALKSALDYVYNRDKNYVALAHEEYYSDGHGIHIHAIIVTSSYVDFSKFIKYAKSRAPVYASFDIKSVTPNLQNILRVTSYVIKNKQEVERAWGNVIEMVSIRK